MARFDDRHTETPGPRTKIMLELADHSLANLLEGEDVERIWLEGHEDGSYSLRATGRVGVTRDAGVKPYVDIVVECANDLADAIDKHRTECPPEVVAVLDRVDARIENYIGEVEPERVKNKHDDACISRRDDHPLVCTCGLSDDAVAAALQRKED